MSGHYLTTDVRFVIEDNMFHLIFRNNHTNAELFLTGPIYGVYENGEIPITEDKLITLGYGLAEFLRNNLTTGETGTEQIGYA